MTPPKSWGKQLLDRWNARQEAPYVVYLLCDPDTMQVRYVGCTGNLQGRYAAHCSTSGSGKSTPVKEWIRELKAQGKKPAIVVHETIIGEDNARLREKEVIREMYVLHGSLLLNKTGLAGIEFDTRLEAAKARFQAKQGTAK